MPAKDDCDQLLNAVMLFARRMLDTEGSYHPFGAQMLTDGEIAWVAAYDRDAFPHAPDLIDLLRESFRSGAADGALKATAIVFDVRVTLPGTERKSDAVAIQLDHRESYSVRVFFPYVFAGGQASIGEAFANDGDYAVFGRSIQ